MVMLYVGGRPVGSGADADRLLPEFAANNQSAEFRDEAGTLLGRFVPAPAACPTEPPPTPPDVDPLTIPPDQRGPDLKLRAALAALRAHWAAGPQFSSPIRDEYLREARAGGMYGDLD